MDTVTVISMGILPIKKSDVIDANLEDYPLQSGYKLMMIIIIIVIVIIILLMMVILL